MLGHWYRYQVYNGTGVSVTATVKDRRWKWASDGARTDAAESTPINAASVGAGAYGVSSNVDNSADKYLGAHLTVTFAPASSATGTVALYLQRSTDGGATWPADGQGVLIGSITFAASSTSVAKNMAIR